MPNFSAANARIRARIRCSGIEGEEEGGGEIEAAREARDWGEIERTGMAWSGDEGGGFWERKERTSVWDCMEIRTASADVMQPL